MNKKQELFCKYYIETNDVKKASAKVGYKEQTGRKLLKNEEIKKYIEKNISINIAKEDEIIKCLTQIMRGEDSLIDDEKIKKGISVKERLKAAELLGKMYAIFSPKQEKINEEPIYILGDDFIED